MSASDAVIVALLQIPTASLAAASIYLALRVRSLGSLLIAIGFGVSFLISVCSNFIPMTQRKVFNATGQVAGTMVDGGALAELLRYTRVAMALLIAVGLVILTKSLARQLAAGVSPNNRSRGP
jgi:hypothetical protein